MGSNTRQISKKSDRFRPAQNDGFPGEPYLLPLHPVGGSYYVLANYACKLSVQFRRHVKFGLSRNRADVLAKPPSYTPGNKIRDMRRKVAHPPHFGTFPINGAKTVVFRGNWLIRVFLIRNK